MHVGAGRLPSALVKYSLGSARVIRTDASDTIDVQLSFFLASRLGWAHGWRARRKRAKDVKKDRED
ncbi:hypothetical protein MGG_17414 [Pyricularia oryzae 70-15]|uniref:Uncharacterized protein n=1 Tax=Pyricularia oryzae (strain 70-15 / ATCC MYA-4617 / FGSC 8958) TaxID=242507 RepID=G4NB85_PYRO7|nr:uncharacterized protein MGG_17414 [Pyricularia oryzae 70-15]EHA48847.1 hypothetical protein MGG_17414 [Pyricularia oryzae 70-15]